MSVLESVERDLAELERRKPGVSEGALAGVARILAAELDGDNPASAKAQCAKALKDVMDALSAVAPAAPLETRIDELASGRARRIARKPAA